MFYYLQIATWEKTYRPEWKELDIMDWVNDVNIDNNHMVKKLAGKVQREEATELDLLRAKNTIGQRMIVGLMTDMEESFNRFNKVLNINEDTDERYKLCMDLYFGGNVAKKSNSNSHPKVSVLTMLDNESSVLYAHLYIYLVHHLTPLLFYSTHNHLSSRLTKVIQHIKFSLSRTVLTCSCTSTCFSCSMNKRHLLMVMILFPPR